MQRLLPTMLLLLAHVCYAPASRCDSLPVQGWQFEYQWFALFFELSIFLLINVLIIFPGPPITYPLAACSC